MHYPEPDALTQLEQKLDNFHRTSRSQYANYLALLNSAENYTRKGQAVPDRIRVAIAARLAYLKRLQDVSDRLLAQSLILAEALTTTASHEPTTSNF
ncbi:MAG: hypothetical protein KME27_10875 [Lyngbya sp. HA4199-MV5]|jgi:hypothetical protein|nr:hypothetical protein [Lyngbya sp. HA4199-MV5]